MKNIDKEGENRLLILYFSLWVLAGLPIVFGYNSSVLFGIGIQLIGVFACYLIAKSNNKEGILWGIAGLLFGFLALLILLLITKQKNGSSIQLKWKWVALAAGLIWGYIILRFFTG